MIPKIIHYCWFGGNPLPEQVKKMISTWKKYCPDYEIKEWNESNFDLASCTYTKEAYNAKKWAFITDYVRLKVIYDYGGIYMDTDVEVCKNLDDLLKWDAFSGFESDKDISTGTMGSVAGNEWIGYLLSYYNNRHFVMQDGSLDLTTNVVTITRMTCEKYDIVLNNRIQVFGKNMCLYPFDYLCAKSYKDGSIHRTKNTYTIHHFSGSWLPKRTKIKNKIKALMKALIVEKAFMYIRSLKKNNFF